MSDDKVTTLPGGEKSKKTMLENRRFVFSFNDYGKTFNIGYLDDDPKFSKVVRILRDDSDMHIAYKLQEIGRHAEDREGGRPEKKKKKGKGKYAKTA